MYICWHATKEENAVIGKLKDIMNNIQASECTVSFSEISSQSLLHEEVNERKRHVSHVFENEVLSAVEHAVKKDVLQIKYNNEHKHRKLERSEVIQ
jgi:predicted N-acyltransferase